MESMTSIHKNQHFQIRSGSSGRKVTLWRCHCKIPTYLIIDWLIYSFGHFIVERLFKSIASNWLVLVGRFAILFSLCPICLGSRDWCLKFGSESEAWGIKWKKSKLTAGEQQYNIRNYRSWKYFTRQFLRWWSTLLLRSVRMDSWSQTSLRFPGDGKLRKMWEM